MILPNITFHIYSNKYPTLFWWKVGIVFIDLIYFSFLPIIIFFSFTNIHYLSRYPISNFHICYNFQLPQIFHSCSTSCISIRKCHWITTKLSYCNKWIMDDGLTMPLQYTYWSIWNSKWYWWDKNVNAPLTNAPNIPYISAYK